MTDKGPGHSPALSLILLPSSFITLYWNAANQINLLAKLTGATCTTT